MYPSEMIMMLIEEKRLTPAGVSLFNNPGTSQAARYGCRAGDAVRAIAGFRPLEVRIPVITTAQNAIDSFI